MIKPWEKTSSKQAGDFRIFTIRSDVKISPRTGKTHDFYVIDSVNWVNVIATTPDQQLEAIITQKYIALNFINSSEAWNEYRRTGYPRSSNFTSDPTTSFASTLSQSSRPDHLPTRILYPASEYSYNAANVPTGVSPYTSLIFWAK